MDYEAAKKNLLALTLRYGYFDAELVQHELRISENLETVAVSLVLESGPRFKFGEISMDWQGQPMRIRDKVLKPFIQVVQGDDYDADKLGGTQSALQTTPYFSSVEVRADFENSSTQEVPIVIGLREQKRHAYNFAVGAGTDTGVRASVGYENRRLNKRGHHFNGRLGTSDIRQTAILNYRIPLPRAKRDSLNFFASLEEEDNDFRTFSVSKLGTELSREWGTSMLNVGLTASREKFFFGEVEQTIDLILPSVGWQKVVSDNPYSPTRGWSASATLRGASESLGSDIDLLQLIVDGKAIVPFGKGRLLLRVKAAGSDVADSTELPASLGFLTGGDRSIRGYRYESIGVPANQLSSVAQSFDVDGDEITVGRHLLVGSIEYEHPLKKGFAVATFLDAGDAFNNEIDLKRGVGAGLRWRLPFGALKLDLASALDRDGTPLRLHLSFGTDL
jgi:translocation and assembly module TamA